VEISPIEPRRPLQPFQDCLQAVPPNIDHVYFLAAASLMAFKCGSEWSSS
jgi:hypothetical protein